MKKTQKTTAVALACLMVAWAGPAAAQERESLEALRQTTLNLIDALVEQKILTREKADQLIREAKDKAAAAAKDDAGREASKTIRVPYVPQVVRDQMREEIKADVLSQARAERWGVPNAAAAWTDNLLITGDIRVRQQHDSFGKGNAPASEYFLAAGSDVTRATDFADFAAGGATGNTTEARDRTRLRARLGLTAKINDWVGAGLRLATGTDRDRVSTNTTLGQNFNKAQFLLDQAWIKLTPTEWASVSAGRMPNPWFSTDLIWDEDLNFDGLAATFKWPQAERFAPFATIGAFPLRDSSPPTRGDRWLYGAQVGAQWHASVGTKLRLGLAYYDYRNIEGRVDTNYNVATATPGVSYGQYQYPDGLRQKGNTLFLTNAPGDAAATEYWGLVSKFRPVAVTAAAEFAQFNPYTLLVSAEYVRNTGYSERDAARRVGSNINPLPQIRKDGYQLRATFGSPAVRESGDWQASLTYRWLGSDAVLDGFTDSDFGLGGTNTQGFILGLSYGIERNTSIGVKYYSARSIDSFSALNDKLTFSVDTLQVDLNVRF